ncbi:MAG: hypothetical protein ABI542_05445 [Gemmatimonadota bacterium]
MTVLRTTALASAVVLAGAAPLAAQETPFRVSQGHLTSAMQPGIQLTIDTSLSYVGSQRWILYDVAQAEQHLYVQRTAAGVRRFLWVQFEEYIPASNGRYDYSNDAPIAAFGRTWRVSPEIWDVPTTEKRPASDGAHARQLLRDHGITLPAQMIYERFIYLPDSTNRRELMVIYAEDAASADVSAKTEAERQAMFAEHQRRALRSFALAGIP